MTRIIIILSVLLMVVCSGPAEANFSIPFEGKLDLPQNQFSLTFLPEQENSIVMNIHQTSSNRFDLILKADHLDTGLLGLSTVLESHVRWIIKPAQMPYLSGQAQGLVIMSKHNLIKEFTSDYEIRDQNFVFEKFKIGDFHAHGRIQLISPFAVNLKARVKDMDLNDLSSFFFQRQDAVLRGKVSGEFELSGYLERPVLKGGVSSYNGSIQDMDYQSVIMNFEGFLPQISISNSHLTESAGLTYRIRGGLDMSRPKELGRQIENLVFEPMINEDGIKREWTLKRLQTQDGESVTELKYLLKKDTSHHDLGESDSGMLGIERQIKF